jgi:hypothetical protein
MNTILGLHGPEQWGRKLHTSSHTATSSTPECFINDSTSQRPTHIHVLYPRNTVLEKLRLAEHSVFYGHQMFITAFTAVFTTYRVDAPTSQMHFSQIGSNITLPRRDISVGNSDSLRAGLSGDRIPLGAKGFRPLQVKTGRGAHPSSCPLVSFPAVMLL